MGRVVLYVYSDIPGVVMVDPGNGIPVPYPVGKLYPKLNPATNTLELHNTPFDSAPIVSAVSYASVSYSIDNSVPIAFVAMSDLIDFVLRNFFSKDNYALVNDIDQQLQNLVNITVPPVKNAGVLPAYKGSGVDYTYNAFACNYLEVITTGAVIYKRNAIANPMLIAANTRTRIFIQGNADEITYLGVAAGTNIYTEAFGYN